MQHTHTCTLFLTSCRCCSSICCFSVTTAAVGCVACPPCCRGDKEGIRSEPQPRDAPPHSPRRFCRKGLHPLAKRSQNDQLLDAALAPGLHSKVQGVGHIPGDRTDRCTKQTATPDRECTGKQKRSGPAAGASPSTNQLLVPNRASGQLCTGASWQQRVRDGGPKTPQALTWAAVAAVWRSRDSSQRQRATMRAISIGFSKYLLCKRFRPPR